MLSKASVWYTVTYSSDIKPLNSTAWVVADLLVKVKLRRASFDKNFRPLTESPLAGTLGHLIENADISYFSNVIPPSNAIRFFTERYAPVKNLLAVLLNWVHKSVRDPYLTLSNANFQNLIMKVCVHKKLNMLPRRELKDLKSLSMDRDIIGSWTEETLGKACFQILQYWASQEFRNSYVSLPFATRREIHEAAFHSFHSIATSGRFHCLYLEPDSDPGAYDSGEFDRLEINGAIFPGITTTQVCEQASIVLSMWTCRTVCLYLSGA